MTKTFKLLCIIALIGTTMITTGCATLSKTQVNLYGYTEDMKVSENGVPLEIKMTYVGSSGMAGYSSGVSYYGAGIRLKRTKADHKILLESGGKTKEVILESKFATGTLFVDLFLAGGPLGIIIDLVAGPLRTTKKKHIDAQYELGNTTLKSRSQLKKEFKKSFKK